MTIVCVDRDFIRKRTMRVVLSCVIGLLSVAVGGAHAQVASTGQDQPSRPRAGNARESDAPPTVEQMQRAVSRLRGGRIQRPATYEALTPEQKEYVKGILSGPRGDISGPLSVMLASPGLGDLTQRVMAFSRFSGREGFSSVDPKYSELGILMVARLWTSEYVWNAHQRYAVQVGVPSDVVESIRLGKRPAHMEKDIETVYNFVDEFLTTKKVSDATFQSTKAVVGGDRGIVDLTGTIGSYQISSMLVVLDQTPLAEGTKPQLPPLN
jgi:4-carboxymuconolactone decarboxylase